VEVGGKWGFIDKAGKMVIPPKYNGAWKFSEGLAAVLTGDEKPWGFIDKTGNMVIPSQFYLPIDPAEGEFANYCGVFSGGLAEVFSLDSRPVTAGYIDRTGKFVWMEKEEVDNTGETPPQR
jgi:hypothetical protein